MSVATWLVSVAILHIVAVLWHWTQRSKGYPHNTFLFHQPARYTDLTNTWREAQRSKPYGQENTTPYFPLVFWVFKCLSRPKVVTVYRFTFAALAIVLAYQWTIPWWATASILLAYPTLFGHDRGNIDPIIGCIMGLSIVLLMSGHPVWGGVALGIAVALKGYPAPLGLMWVLQGQWSGLWVAIASTILLISLPARTFEGGIVGTLRGVRHGIGGFHEMASVAPRGPAYAVSHYCFTPLDALRLLYWWRGKTFDARKATRPYLVFSTAWAMVMTWCAWSTGHTWVALMALGIVCCIWPYTANDYRLCALFPGIAAWLAAGAPNPVVWLSLLLLWIPKQYWFPNPKVSWGSISCVINPIAILALSVALWRVF